jgi:multimeric flavodoxin WrbA
VIFEYRGISMKVIAFNGSARKQGNTAILINHVFSELEKEGIETELVELAGKKIQGCTACYKCFETKDRNCAIHAFDSINYFFHINQMIIPGSSYWNVGIGREIGDVDKDQEGIRNMKNLGENMAWLLKKIRSE